MIEYIYFVKCPNCEDEHFYFFNDAKECAMSQLSKKPIITQTEVNRNDFGECTDSCDLGTVWSWEDMMKDMPTESEQTAFSKANTVGCDNCFDREFDELDNSLEPTEIRKPVPADMSIDDLVEAMEANEDDVECRNCEELFDKSECVYDKDYHGWLCSACQRAAVKQDHGGDLNIGEAPLTESSKYKDSVEFHYDTLTTTITTGVIPATFEDPEDYREGEYTDEFDFEVETNTVEEVLWDFLTEEDVSDVPGGLEALEDDAAWRAFLDVHFEELLEKYNDKFLEYFKEDAKEAAKEEFQERYAELYSEGPDPDHAYDERHDEIYFGESVQKPFLEEFDDAETHKANLTDCPECGTVSYDMKEQYCSNCGLGL